MDRFWLPRYPAGTPADIDPSEFRSLKALIESACERYAERTAYRSMGSAMSYRTLTTRSAAFGAWLQRAGFQRGERIAIMLPNLLQYPIAMFGALRAGLTVVNTNPLYTSEELAVQLQDSGAVAVVVLENFAATLQAALPATSVRAVIVTAVGDLLHAPKGMVVNFVLRYVQKKVPHWQIPGAHRFNAVLAAGSAMALQPVELGHEDLAFLQYTGGTTGGPKGAMLTHGNMVANILQCRAWFLQVALEHTTFVCALPLYHIFSLTANCLLFARLGAKNVLITNPRDFPAFVTELRKHKFFYISGVNTLFNALLHTPGFETLDFSALKITLGGGMAVQAVVAARWKKVTGNVLTQAWGLTETSPAACINPMGLDFNGSIGLPISSTDVSIRNDVGVEMGTNEVGEICVFGPQLMRDYWNRPDETEQVMFGDWLRTGDIGRMDEQGFVFIEDRKKDMILVSGFNVYPNEIEAVAAEHPGVLEVAAVAQLDENSGESVALFVVKKDPSLTAEALIEYCRAKLTGYKVPKHVYFRSELPKTNVGKILRRALRDELRGTQNAGAQGAGVPTPGASTPGASTG